MNNWHNEFMAEYHRRDILKQAEQIRLEGSVVKSGVYRPGWFERRMLGFANWMIATGKQLRKRYTRSSPVDKVPAVDCRKTATGNFAH